MGRRKRTNERNLLKRRQTTQKVRKSPPPEEKTSPKQAQSTKDQTIEGDIRTQNTGMEEKGLHKEIDLLKKEIEDTAKQLSEIRIQRKDDK